MAKLNTTLPKNFRDLIVAQDWDTLKAELQQCEPLAYEKGGVSHAIFGLGQHPWQNIYLPLDMIRWLIEENSCPIEITYANEDLPSNLTLLGFYVSERQLDIVKLLLELGANPNPALYERPLEKAIINKDNQIIELLLDKGADVNFIGFNSSDTTLLNLAIAFFNPIAIKLLLARGATPNTESTEHTAIEYLLVQLEDSGSIASNNLNHNTNTAIEPFILEQGENVLEIAKLLIEHGADLHRPLTKELLQNLNEQFYQCHLKQLFSNEKIANKIEQFELKLYELMQFEPN